MTPKHTPPVESPSKKYYIRAEVVRAVMVVLLSASVTVSGVLLKYAMRIYNQQCDIITEQKTDHQIIIQRGFMIQHDSLRISTNAENINKLSQQMARLSDHDEDKEERLNRIENIYFGKSFKP